MKLYDSGRTYLLRARQFAHVVVEFSDDGQKADARLWDSPGDDIFEGTLGNCRFYSNETDFDVTILGANFVTVRTTNGGNDRAILHDSPEADVFRAKPHKVEMGDRATGGELHEMTVRGFKDIIAYADNTTPNADGFPGGRDIAKIYDSALDDIWEAEYVDGQTWSRLSSSARELYEAMAFEQMKGYSAYGGTNQLQKRITPPQVDFVLTHGVWDEI